MPGTYCQYINCKRTRRKPGRQNLRLFRFPNNQDISKQWIINCGRTKFFELEPKQLHSKSICELHFTPESFMDPLYKQRLIPSAVPVHFSEDQTDAITLKLEVPSPRSESPLIDPLALPTTPIKTYKPAEKRHRPIPKPPSPDPETDIDTKCIDLKLSPDPQSSRLPSPGVDEENITDTPHFPLHQQSTLQNQTTTGKRKLSFKETQWKSKIEKQRKMIKVKQEQLRRMKAKVAKLKELSRLETVFDNFDFPSQHSKTLAKMQLKTLHRQWTIEERNLALMMFYQSPTTYVFLRRLGIVMPSDSTIRHWIGQTKFQASFSKRFLKRKSDNAPPCFDGISTNDEGAIERNVTEGCEEVEDFGHVNSDPSSVSIQEESVQLPSE